MEYSPGTIIKYKENYGRKRSLYGIVLEQYNSNCFSIFSELKEERIISLFIDSNTTPDFVTIEKILNSYKEIPERDEKGNLSRERFFLRDIGRLVESVKGI